MFTRNMAIISIWIFTVGSTIGFSPYKVDRKVGKLYVDSLSRAWSLWNWIWLVAYAYLVLPTHLYELYMTNQFHKFNYTVIIMLCCSMGIILVGDLVWMAHGTCQFLNALFKFIQDFPDKYMQAYDFKRDYKLTKFLEVFMFISYIFCLWLGFMVAAHCYLRPFAPPYLIFGMDNRYVSTFIYLLASSWFSWFAVGVTAVLGAIPCFGIFYFAYILPIIRHELRLGEPRYKTSSLLREPYQLVLNWRSLEIFVKYVNVEMAFIFVYLQIVFVEIILFSVVTLTYQWDDLRLNTIVFLFGTSLFALLGWSLFLIVAGYQYSCSQLTLDSWRLEIWNKRTDRLYMEKVKLACRPFSLGDGRRYFIRPISAMKYMNSVSKNTFRAMITYANVMGLY